MPWADSSTIRASLAIISLAYRPRTRRRPRSTWCMTDAGSWPTAAVRAAHFGGLPVSIPVNGRMDTGRLPQEDHMPTFALIYRGPAGYAPPRRRLPGRPGSPGWGTSS